ncbi:ABC transporter ATP-binding protein [Ferribacterium limneticum]|uniref:ABC transporter ATP-binding protein n=1 Tax=Ferribacterium limneticum TaxID=76259 RepID=UPI001CF8E301|nr:ABC transporter ATP-binding protein [Ferribacterium limneticum]UCV24521.1 ABC transporter ATP-binding protein [Ferribacterium limneticum]
MAGKPVIEVSGLGKTVDNGGEPLTILQDISFSVMPGETVAIVGASGSGKSTLLGLLAGLDSPTAGEVRLDDVSLNSLDEDQRARLRGRLLGFVFQSFQLLPSLNALENVMLPLELAGSSKSSVAAGDWLERVGLSHRLKHYPKHLSGGEQQRVALARAFAPNPQLVLADEPTGNLDAATGQQVIDLMFDLNARQGTTLLLVTHDEAIAARCGRVLRIQSGRLAG